jgi:hypothetical protein
MNGCFIFLLFSAIHIHTSYGCVIFDALQPMKTLEGYPCFQSMDDTQSITTRCTTWWKTELKTIIGQLILSDFRHQARIKICRVSACYFGNKAIFGTTQNQSDEESRIVQTIESSEFLFPSDINIRSIQTLSTALLHFLKPNSKNEIFKLPLRFS